MLRLEVFFAPDQPPKIPDGFVCDRLQPGHWRILLDRQSQLLTQPIFQISQGWEIGQSQS
jgi:hypothetical protein